jgi:hypothetical protein
MYTLPIICSWCGIKTGERTGFLSDDPAGTSTICPSCFEKEMNCKVLPNGKRVFIKDGKAFQRLPNSQWQEIDIKIIETTMPELLK